MCVATGMVEVFFADLFTLKYFEVFSRQSLFGSESQNDMRSFAPFVGSGNQGEGNSPRTVTVKDPWNRNWYATWSTWCQHSEYWMHVMWYLYFAGRVAIYKLDEEMQDNITQYITIQMIRRTFKGEHPWSHQLNSCSNLERCWVLVLLGSCTLVHPFITSRGLFQVKVTLLAGSKGLVVERRTNPSLWICEVKLTQILPTSTKPIETSLYTSIQIMLFFSSFDFDFLRSNICISSNQRRRRLAEMTAGGRSNILDPARRCRLDSDQRMHHTFL